MDDELYNKILAKADEQEIRGEKLNDILLWFLEASTNAAIVSSFEKGLIEFVDVDENKGPLFRLTEEGKKIIDIIEKEKKDA